MLMTRHASSRGVQTSTTISLSSALCFVELDSHELMLLQKFRQRIASLPFGSPEAVTRCDCSAGEIPPVFPGTRVSVSALFENLRAGASLKQFLDWFQGVERWQVESVLDHEVKALAGAGGQ